MSIVYAKKVVISLIKSPLYSNSVKVDNELKVFFIQARQLKLNDIFQVPSLNDPSDLIITIYIINKYNHKSFYILI
jgi:hypothetical protein